MTSLVNCSDGKISDFLLTLHGVVSMFAATSIPEMIARLDALPRPPSIEERDEEELPEREGL